VGAAAGVAVGAIGVGFAAGVAAPVDDGSGAALPSPLPGVPEPDGVGADADDETPAVPEALAAALAL